MKLISLKSDYAFKELFSHENVRKQFLSDVLGIPLEHIKSAKLVNPHLWVRYRKQKQGILDVLMELNGDVVVDVEMQVRLLKHWIKRQLFYLAKMYTEELKRGEEYDKLRRCISIAVLDFDLMEGEEYHSVYYLRDRSGKNLTDLFQIHIIELGKELQGTKAVDDWIRLFNAKRGEELDMIMVKNDGLREAIEILKEMSLNKSLRYKYEMNLKLKRDRKAEDDYVRDCGKAEGKAEDIIQLLGELGPVPTELADKIMSEKNLDVLRVWLRAAARAESVQEFRKDCEV